MITVSTLPEPRGLKLRNFKRGTAEPSCTTSNSTSRIPSKNLDFEAAMNPKSPQIRRTPSASTAQVFTSAVHRLLVISVLSFPLLASAGFGMEDTEGECTEIWSDDFESPTTQWATNFRQEDTAVAGFWEQADPQETVWGGAAYQLGDTPNHATGDSQSLVTDSRGTGGLARNDVYNFDVDGGVTSIASPEIMLPSGGSNYQVSFNYNFAFLGTCCHSNNFKAIVIDEAGAASVEFIASAWTLPNPPAPGTPIYIPGQWQPVTLNLDQFAGQTIRIEFEARDEAPTDAATEAQVDDVSICYTPAETNSPPQVVGPEEKFSYVGNSLSEQGPLFPAEVVVFDAEGDEFTCNISGLPPGLQETKECEVSGTVTATPGDYTVTVMASDGQLNSEPYTFAWHVVEGQGGECTTFWSDDFEDDEPPWITNPDPPGSDTATAGFWERAIAEETLYQSQRIQLGSTPTTGSLYSLVTDGRGGDPDAYDVDSPPNPFAWGWTTVASPTIVIPADGSGHRLEFFYNFAGVFYPLSASRFRAELHTSSSSITLLEAEGYYSFDATEIRAGNWDLFSIDVSQWAGETVQIFFSALEGEYDQQGSPNRNSKGVDSTEGGFGDILEAQVDDVRLCHIPDNSPPVVLPIAPRESIVNQPVDPLIIEIFDPDPNETHTCELVSTPPIPGLVEGPECEYSGTITATGVYTVEVTADDGENTSEPVEFVWTVLSSPDVADPDDPPAPADPPFISNSIVEDSSRVGATSGEFRVDQSGSATYSIPILTAPGSGGLEPKIGLNYSSQDGNGVVGVGWSIGGLSAITRCGQTLAQDGSAAEPGITLTENDRFCLDGERMMLISNHDYGESGAQYRLERDTIVKIVSNGSAGNGPQSFTVWRKDGTVTQYGGTENSRIQARTLDDEATVLIWAQNRISDSASNYIDFNYEEMAGSAGDPIEYVLTEVNYTGNSGINQPTYAQILFEYDTDRSDVTERSVAGSTIAQTRRLIQIDSVSSEPTNSSLRSYFLEYDDDGYGREILQSVTECSDANQNPSDPNDICFSPAYFGWHTSYHEVPTGGTGISGGVFPSPSVYQDSALADINGDARPDLLITQGSGSVFTFKVALALPEGGFAPAGTQSYSIPAGEGGTEPVNLYAIDLNADGYQDVIYPASDTWKYRLSNGSDLGSQQDATPVGQDCCGELSPDIVWVMDMNGDGLADLVTSKAGTGGGITFLRNIYSPATPGVVGFAEDQFIVPSVAGLFPVVESNFHRVGPIVVEHWLGGIESRFSRVTDFNNDGAADIIVRLSASYCDGNHPSGDCPPPPPAPEGGEPEVVFTESAGEAPDGFPVPTYPTPIYVAMVSTGSSFRWQDVAGVAWDCLEFENPVCNYFSGSEVFDAAEDVEDIIAVDINADGLGDFAYTNINAQNSDFRDWKVRRNRGGYFDSDDISISPNIHRDIADLSQFTDLNGDGYPEFLAPRSNSGDQDWDIWFNQFGLDFGAKVPSELRFGNFNEGDRSLFADFNGDGMQDNFFINFNSSGALDLSGTLFHKGFNDEVSGGHAATVIDLISTGVGPISQQQAVEIEYLPLTDSNVYTRMSDSSVAAWDAGSGVMAVYDLVAPLYVVSETSRSAPTFGSPGATTDMRYHYVGAKIQGGGRGFLGFGEMVVFDEATGIRTNTRFRQDFPFIGMPGDVTQVLPDSGREVSPVTSLGQSAPKNWGSVSATTQPDIVLAGDDLLRHAVYELGSIETESDKGSIFSFSANILERQYTLGGNLERKTLTAFAYEGTNGRYGNLTASTVQTFEVDGTTAFATQVTDNDYADNISQWHLGRLSRSEVTHSRVGTPDIKRVSEFEYDPSTGILDTEIIEPDTNQYKVTTVYSLDAFGNRDSITVTGYEWNGFSWVPMPQRETQREYDQLGRFIAESRNSYNQITFKLLSWDQFGNPTLSENIDGVQTVVAADYMGRPYQTYTQIPDTPNPIFSGESTHSLHELGGGGFCPSASFGLTSFYTYVGIAGQPDQVQCFDILGREMRSATQGFESSSWINVDTYYDAAGRVAQISEPDFSGVPSHWNYTTYDDLGRIASVMAANGNDLSYEYDEQASLCSASGEARQVRTQNSLGQFRLEIRNALGEPTTVYDDICGDVHHTYDAVGNPLTITGVDGEVMEMEYDVAGRKTFQDDPDAGIREYRYNSFGEVTRQYDAKNQAIDFEYDELARVIEREERINVSSMTGSGTLVYYESSTWNNSASSGSMGKGQILNLAYVGTAEGLIEQRNYSYDEFSRVTEIETINDGLSLSAFTAYDEHSRVFQQFDVTGDSRGIQYHYNGQGYLWKLQEAREGSQSGVVYQEILEMDQRHNVTEMRLGEGGDGLGVFVENAYHDNSGRLFTQDATASDGVSSLQSIVYAFDVLGNLEVRDDNTPGRQIHETFDYDDLNRLTDITTPGGRGITGEGMGSQILAMAFDASGNITSRLGVGVYAYDETGNAGPHAVTSVDGPMGEIFYSYDENGNLVSGAGRDTTYTVFNKPRLITQDLGGGMEHATEFTYGIGQSRSKRVDTYASGDTKITWYFENVERIQWNGGTVQLKRYLGGNALMDCTPVCHPSNVSYLVKDHLGSIYAVTDQDGTAVSAQSMSFMAFGQRRVAGGSDPLSPGAAEMLNDRTTRGYAGHEHADRVGLIHMNGRTYDPWLGRFMQADPVVQDAMNGQNLNRYSYVLNNPMRYTDPSGYYWFDGSWDNFRFVALSSSYPWNGTFSSTDYFRVPADYVRDQNAWSVNIVLSNLAAGTVPTSFSSFEASAVEDYSVTANVGAAIVGGTDSDHAGTFANGALTEAFLGQHTREVRVWSQESGVTVTTSIDRATNSHVYVIRGVICRKAQSHCTEDYADRVFDRVNQNDIPFVRDDVGTGPRVLIPPNPFIGRQQIQHEENILERKSVNIAEEEHLLYPGSVEHSVHFENGELVYEVIGTGTGWNARANNILGIFLFRREVVRTVEEFGQAKP